MVAGLNMARIMTMSTATANATVTDVATASAPIIHKIALWDRRSGIVRPASSVDALFQIIKGILNTHENAINMLLDLTT
jgi:ethanolamine utilization microcompartment shell protein EutS